jgi:hypothetical protein
MLGMVSSTIFATAVLGKKTSSKSHSLSLVVVDGGLDDDGRNLVSPTSHCLGSRNGVASSKWRSKKLEGKSEKRWDLMCSALYAQKVIV